MLWFRHHVLRRFAAGDRGVTAVEYGVIVALFVAGLFGVVKLLNTSLQASYSASGSRVGSPQSLMPAPSLPSYNPSAAGCDTSVMFYDPLSGACEPKVTCDPATQWPNPSTNECDASARPACNAASKGFDSATNSCVECTASRPYDAGTGTCAATAAACAASGTWFNSAALTCDPIPVCSDPAQPYDSGTNTCQATASNCSVSIPFDVASGSCKATVTTCAAQSPARWYNGGGPTCDPIPSCMDPAVPYDSGTNMCKATATTCAAQSPARWFNAVAGTCDPIPSCTDPAVPYDSLTNTCKATATTCAAQSPARWYNAVAGTCDPIPACTDPAVPYDSGTNTCKATVANCPVTTPFDSASQTCKATSSSCTTAGRWYNSGAGTCDAFATCTSTQYWTSSNNVCQALPVVTKCYTQPNNSASTYSVMAGFTPAGAVLTSVDDPSLSRDTNPTLTADKLGIRYTTPSRNSSWPSGGVITITFDYEYSYVQNGVAKKATQSGSFTITRGGTASSNPISSC